MPSKENEYNKCPICAATMRKGIKFKHRPDCAVGLMQDARNIGIKNIHTQQGQLTAVDFIRKKESWLKNKEMEILTSFSSQLADKELTAKQIRLLLDFHKRLQQRKQRPRTVSGGGGPGTGKRR